MATQELTKKQIFTKEEVLNDYLIACVSRQASYIGRKEVFMGKAKFGIFGDGKETAQLAMAKVFREGDFRSGYYRDQTFMLAIGELTLEQCFAQLYSHADIDADPASAGRMMNNHFATRSLNEDGSWKDLTQLKNSSPDLSPNCAQMPRLLGLAYASKLYRQNPGLQELAGFSDNGNEIAFGTIGDSATSEGMFFETMNAAGVLQVPMLVSVWDDGYGISVPRKYQTTKDSISELLQGFQRTKDKDGYEILTVLGWDYEGLCKTYRKAEKICRKEHVPVLIHVQEMTQPQGHSTSGSHERYKSKERLQWEDDFDPIRKMREWILNNEYAGAEELDTIEMQAKENAKQARVDAWNTFVNSMKGDQDEAVDLIRQLADESVEKEKILSVKDNLEKTLNPARGDAIAAVKKVLRIARLENTLAKQKLSAWCEKVKKENYDRFSSHLYSQSADAALNVQEVEATYKDDSPVVDGREVLLACFDAALSRDPRVLAFGEDLGKIGDVNQGFAGLQEKYGEIRVTDTGIRECTIIGQGIGLAMRGLRPIAEIQYLDYLLYALQIMSDDLATVQYRTRGGQKAPLIIRTRGHRLEGIWHSGSPIGTILHSCRGIYVLVPRNMTRAAGFYNTMLRSDDPALIIECLNGYRIKEKIPSNIGELTVPIGVPEILKEGTDITIVTYGSMCRIVMEAADQLEETGIACEVIDVQTLLPFDIHHKIVESVKKTNRVIFADEDVPGGASAYMMQGVLEEQDAYYWLDSQPRTLSAMPHRPAYGSDGDYFSKPNIEDVFDLVYEMMHEAEPGRFPAIY